MKEVDSPYGPGCVGVISGDDMARFHHLVISLDSLQVPKGSVYCHATGCNPARNSNNLVRMMLEQPQMQWLWIMGDDHCFDDDILLKLLSRDKDCIMPLCARRMFSFDPVVMKEFVPEEGKHSWYTWEEIEGFTEPFPVAAGGSAGLLVKRHVFERMRSPWFEVGAWIRDDLQEDVFFTHRANKMGHTVYCDNEAFIGHITNAVMFPKRGVDGKIGVASNLGGYKLFVLPPGWAAKHGPNGEHLVRQPGETEQGGWNAEHKAA